MCRLCGEESETIEHALLNCSYVKQVWRLAPIQWEGMMDQQGYFRKWWTNIAEAKSRSEGNEQLSLTANILWQIWKSRNDKEFNRNQNPSIRTVQKAQEEWLEFVEATAKASRMSIEETSTRVTFSQHEEMTKDTLRLRLATKKMQNSPHIGIGIIISLNNQEPVRRWALHDRSTGHQLIDDIAAVKLLMSKAVMQEWRKIEIQMDIRKDSNHLSDRISGYALGILQDEEFWFPQCMEH
ncbi:uncharacterized protein [Coffea arabica]|uniref:Reverse transcriptase zinc-binding domain-containing protein n=1 Tax=Coffea arabica TaxID=13443 RepID=A0ABM4UYK9_COFAR